MINILLSVRQPFSGLILDGKKLLSLGKIIQKSVQKMI